MRREVAGIKIQTKKTIPHKTPQYKSTRQDGETQPELNNRWLVLGFIDYKNRY
jgi:hypothetical protein